MRNSGLTAIFSIKISFYAYGANPRLCNFFLAAMSSPSRILKKECYFAYLIRAAIERHLSVCSASYSMIHTVSFEQLFRIDT